jgi:hypothetical protein
MAALEDKSLAFAIISAVAALLICSHFPLDLTKEDPANCGDATRSSITL